MQLASCARVCRLSQHTDRRLMSSCSLNSSAAAMAGPSGFQAGRSKMSRGSASKPMVRQHIPRRRRCRSMGRRSKHRHRLSVSSELRGRTRVGPARSFCSFLMHCFVFDLFVRATSNLLLPHPWSVSTNVAPTTLSIALSLVSLLLNLWLLVPVFLFSRFVSCRCPCCARFDLSRLVVLLALALTSNLSGSSSHQLITSENASESCLQPRMCHQARLGLCSTTTCSRRVRPISAEAPPNAIIAIHFLTILSLAGMFESELGFFDPRVGFRAPSPTFAQV